MKPNVYGRVAGSRANAVIDYPVGSTTGILEDKTINDFVLAVRQVSEVYRKMGAYAAFPNGNDPEPILKQQMSLFVTTSGALHPQGTCRAGVDPATAVTDTWGMSFNIKNLMCCDASIIPNHISSNPNAMIMALASRCADFVNSEILGARSASKAIDELAREEAAKEVRQ
jgi:choline dehydrogenase-like flavoprotein